MFCAQDSLAEEDSGGEPAALAAVSQYACKRRTTIDNYNKIFTVSVNNKNIKNERKKISFFPHKCSFAHLRQLIFSNVFFCQNLFCSNLDCGGYIIRQTRDICKPRHGLPGTSHKPQWMCPSAICWPVRERGAQRGEARRGPRFTHTGWGSCS